jgi:cholesterol transport system auxiliary component
MHTSFRHLSLCIILLSQGGCSLFPSSPSVITFDLTNPLRDSPASSLPNKVKNPQKYPPILINEPLATHFVDSDNIVVRGASGTLTALKGVRWSDPAPRILQTRLVRELENRGLIRQVMYPSQPAGAQRQLLWEIRRFQIVESANSPATVQIQVAARIMDIHSGHAIAARLFSASQPLEKVNVSQAVTAFDSALSSIIFEICAWIM